MVYFKIISNISEANVNSVHCINPLHDLEVCDGDTLDLEVTLSDLDPEVIWLHNGTILRESMWISMTAEGFKRKLTIYSCTKKDGGIYACLLKENYTPETDSKNVTVLTFCDVTVCERRKPTLKEKGFDMLKSYQKLVLSVEDSVFEHVALVLCVAAVIYMWCMYFCQELLERDYPEAFQ